LLRKILSELFIIFNSFLGIKIFLAVGFDLLEFNRAVQCEGHALKQIVLVQISAIPSLVLEHHSLIVFCLAVDETYVKQPGNQNKQNEECTKEHLYFIVFFEQEARQRDRDVVAATWTVRVSILLEVLSCNIISQDLNAK